MTNKPIFKDTQTSIRFSSEILKEMKEDAKAENISLSDFIHKIYKHYKQTEGADDIRDRLSALESFIYQQSKK